LRLAVLTPDRAVLRRLGYPVSVLAFLYDAARNSLQIAARLWAYDSLHCGKGGELTKRVQSGGKRFGPFLGRFPLLHCRLKGITLRSQVAATSWKHVPQKPTALNAL